MIWHFYETGFVLHDVVMLQLIQLSRIISFLQWSYRDAIAIINLKIVLLTEYEEISKQFEISRQIDWDKCRLLIKKNKKNYLFIGTARFSMRFLREQFRKRNGDFLSDNGSLNNSIKLSIEKENSEQFQLNSFAQRRTHGMKS